MDMNDTKDIKGLNTKGILTIDIISAEVGKVAEEYPVKRATLFGSYADGTATEESDVDILMEFDTPTVSLFTLSEIRIKIANALKKGVDLIHGPLPDDAMIEINREVQLYEA